MASTQTWAEKSQLLQSCLRVRIGSFSTHSKDEDSQWPKLWAGKTVRLGKRNSIRFPLCAVTFGLELPLGT